MQARLLRVLEERRVRPLGSETSIPVDFRLLSSSRRPAAELQSGDRLRRDFLYRVNTEVITIPPLRERKEDIRPLVLRALEEHASREGTPAPHVTDAAWRKLEDHDWPGNVRELLNEISRALVARPVEITPEMILARSAKASPGPGPERLPSLREGRLKIERELVVAALRAHGGNVSRAARALRVTRRYLTTLIQKHGIPLGEHRGRAEETQQ
jgi:transcriptional regulator with PAS, ATPase and Fis domain